MSEEKGLRYITPPDRAPSKIPYTAGVAAGGFLYISGQVPLDPATGKLVGGDFKAAVHQVIGNLRDVARAAGTDLDRIVKVTVFLTDMGNFKALNEVYSEYFNTDPPARSAIQVAGLPLGAEVEMEAVALLPE
ncbi:MAG: Rid family detoxifying hydrolase [Proteobacteria bacterium]|nr:Rid family detoxifying hydrolase [Pseudomonadota bacterium]